VFIENKYTKIYHNIIDNAIRQSRIKRRSTHRNYVYYENHHIIPRSIGGSDDSSNLVLLSAREHFICHYLLCKMFERESYEWHKMVRAFTYMYASSRAHKRYFNSRLYEAARKDIGTIMSESQSGEGNSQFGTTWVTNVELRDCRKVDSSDVKEYINKGYIKKRIVSWDAYDKKQTDKILSKQNKIKKDIEKLDEKIFSLDSQKKSLLTELALLEGVEPS